MQLALTPAAAASAASISAAAGASAPAAAPAAPLREAVPTVHGTPLGRAEGNLRLLTTVAAGRLIRLTGATLASAPGVTECH